MSTRYSDIDPMDIDPETGRPYAGYSSPSLDDSFHEREMAIDCDCKSVECAECVERAGLVRRRR